MSHEDVKRNATNTIRQLGQQSQETARAARAAAADAAPQALPAGLQGLMDLAKSPAAAQLLAGLGGGARPPPTAGDSFVAVLAAAVSVLGRELENRSAEAIQLRAQLQDLDTLRLHAEQARGHERATLSVRRDTQNAIDVLLSTPITDPAAAGRINHAISMLSQMAGIHINSSAIAPITSPDGATQPPNGETKES